MGPLRSRPNATGRFKSCKSCLRRGETPAKDGPSPGVRDLRWLKPVYAGDTISFAREVTELRESTTRPGWGLMVARNTGTNQKGELVLSFVGAKFAERRMIPKS